MTAPDQARAIAAKLTVAQSDVLCAMHMSWSFAPYCGWHRRRGQVAKALVQHGLADMDKNRTSDGTPMFCLTALGQAVRAILQEQSNG